MIRVNGTTIGTARQFATGPLEVLLYETPNLIRTLDNTEMAFA